MAKLGNLLTRRLKPSKEKVVDAVAQRSTDGELSSFSGVFRLAKLSNIEKEDLCDILEEYRTSDQESLSSDLEELAAVTSEVKAISNQAVILHGERIKRAQDVLKKYREGAFSSWMVLTYGNRQTPYNFLQYFEFYKSLGDELKKQIDNMPRQIIYALASRDGSDAQKERFISEYKGQSKKELLTLLRSQFPIATSDNRKENVTEKVIRSLENLVNQTRRDNFRPNSDEASQIHLLLDQIRTMSLKK